MNSMKRQNDMVEYKPGIKKNETMPPVPFVAPWTEPGDDHTMWSKSERERKMLYDITYMSNLKKNDKNEVTYKTEIASQTLRANLCLPKGKGKDQLGVWSE